MVAGCTDAVRVDPTTSSPPSTLPAEGPIRGALPDGTVYDIITEPPIHKEPVSVSAGIAVMTDNGDIPLGEVVFAAVRPAATGWVEDRLYRLDGGDWTIDVELSDPGLAALGPDPEREVETGMVASTNLGLPVLELSAPLRWDQSAGMEVVYPGFVVRRGCAPGATACNPTHAVSVIADRGALGEEVWVESYALRPESDTHYLDPGPLPARRGHDLIWTGGEMVVWGGFANSIPRLDGAAFDPEEGTWRMLPPIPLDNPEPTRSVWTGTELVVVSESATFALDPGADRWRRVGEGTQVPTEPGRMVAASDGVMVWSDLGIRMLDPVGGRWIDLPDPGLGDPGVLRVMDGVVYAVAAGECEIREIAALVEGVWRHLPPAEVGCSKPEQTAAGEDRIVVWSDSEHLTLAYDPAGDEWETISTIPLAQAETPSGPLWMGDRFLVTRWLEGAIHHPGSDNWTEVDLPGYGTDLDMVWTGSEVLMWDQCCYGPADVDAWRWSPPGEP